MQIADQLRLHATAPDEVHYELDHKGKQATLTEAGLHAVYAKLGRSSLQLIHKIQDLTVWGVQPVVTHQTSRLPRTWHAASCFYSIKTCAISFNWSDVGSKGAYELGNRQACFPSHDRACACSCSTEMSPETKIAKNNHTHA